MQLALKLALLKKGEPQYKVAAKLGWDPTKLSRIVQDVTKPTAEDRQAIARYLQMNEEDLFTHSEVSSAVETR